MSRKDVDRDPIRVYLSGPAGASARAHSFAAALRAGGFEVSSVWHEPGAASGDGASSVERRDILWRGLTGIATSDVIVAMFAEGEPEEAYCEVGAGLAMEKLVLWIGEGESNFRAHPKVRVLPGLSETVELLGFLQREGEEVARVRRRQDEFRAVMFTRLRQEAQARMKVAMDRIEGLPSELKEELLAAAVKEASGILTNHRDQAPSAWAEAAVEVISGSVMLAMLSKIRDESQGGGASPKRNELN